MKKNILVRNAPIHVIDWIEKERARTKMSQQEVVLSTLERAANTQLHLFADRPAEPLNAKVTSLPFSFIDLFAGIGGFRLALQHLGGKCVYTSEWDKYAQKTYQAWFGDLPEGDIRSIEPTSIPDHDVLAAGFPCQPFSIAGVSKKNSLGRAHGFDDVKQGNLFFVLADIIRAKRPPVLFLENVKNLQSHDGGRTWAVIEKTLKELQYHVFPKIIDAAGWVPQHRERMYIVCFNREYFPERPMFQFPTYDVSRGPKLATILETSPDSRYTLTEHLWKYLQGYAEKHRLKGNGFGFGIGDPQGIARTLSARYYKDGSEILIRQRGRNPRRLTPSECAKLMGFPEHLPIVVSDTQAYKQFGNAVVPKVVEAIGQEIMTILAAQFSTRCLLKEPSADTTARAGHVA
jgi:DNA (cytosine-5)-methyltransferase 1